MLLNFGNNYNLKFKYCVNFLNFIYILNIFSYFIKFLEMYL